MRVSGCRILVFAFYPFLVNIDFFISVIINNISRTVLSERYRQISRSLCENLNKKKRLCVFGIYYLYIIWFISHYCFVLLLLAALFLLLSLRRVSFVWC